MRIAGRLVTLFTLASVGCVPGMQNRWASWGVNWTGVPASADPTSVAAPVPYGPVTTNTAAPAGNLVIYVHGGGGRIHGGSPSDAPRWVSSTVSWHGLTHADFPGFEGTQDEWRQVMSCAQGYFAGFPVTLVDQQPSSGDYLLAVVSGSMSVFDTNAWGEADTGVGGIVERGTGFVFSADHQTDHRAQRICETLSHEIGHMLGLNHVDQCQDLMSANAACVWDGARPGFLDGNRQILATHLARYGHSVQPPAEPARIVDLRALDVIKMSDGTNGWPVNVTANRPLVRAVTYRRYEDGTVTEWPCAPNGNGCDIVDSTARSVHLITPGSTTQVKFVVFFEDGTSQESGWATISWGG